LPYTKDERQAVLVLARMRAILALPQE